MSSYLQQVIFMQRDRESKQSTASNIQQEMNTASKSNGELAQFEPASNR
jgi:hypothetical protein